MSLTVVVTGAGALLGQGVIRSLRGSALDVRIVALDPSPLAAGLYWADEAHLVPMASEPDYLERVVSLLRRIRPDAVLVGTDVELGIFATHRSEVEAELGTDIVVSSPSVIGIADDKYETFRFLREHGFPRPASCLPGEEDALVEQVGFPLVVKPRVGARAVGVHLVRDREQLERRIAEVDNPVIQQMAGEDGHEYTAGALFFDGEVEATIVMRRDLRDGNTYRAWVEPYPELNEQVRQLTRALQPYGPVNFQFRLSGGEAKAFEINARFSGTTPFRMHAGFNEVEHVLRRVVLGERPEPPSIRPTVLLRHWTETVLAPEDLLGEQP